MDYQIVDLPGTYSLASHSEEEEIARDYICSGQADLILVVCDATCLERGLHLLKQIGDLKQIPQCCLGFDKGCDNCYACDSCQVALSPLPRIAVCVNLCDEAEKKGIHIDFSRLQADLNLPVIPCKARERQGLKPLLDMLNSSQKAFVLPTFSPQEVAAASVTYTNQHYRRREERLDRLLTGRFTGSVIMLLLLLTVFWLTITGANYPSAWLWDRFYSLELWLDLTFSGLGLPPWLIQASVHGVYRVVAWVVSVMLPPMAIFFPLFTLLEDLGYLPRVAFNMDRAFHSCKACGKQCLTMWWGFMCKRIQIW